MYSIPFSCFFFVQFWCMITLCVCVYSDLEHNNVAQVALELRIFMSLLPGLQIRATKFG